MPAYYGKPFEGRMIDDPAQLPDGDVYGVLEQDSVSYDVNYGPPDRGTSVTKKFLELIVFPTKEQWAGYVQACQLEKGRYKPLGVPVFIRKAKTTVSISVAVEER